MMKLGALAAVLATSAQAAVPADKVTTIPGFGAPLSDTYSGYLSAGNGKHYHYVFTASLNKPSTDPVVLWFNGGPGCSSMEGFLSESGLYHIQEFSSPPTLAQNPFSWTNITNSLYLESPTGVGYSYCDTPDECSHTDTSTAADNLAAIQSFFAAFPEYKNNDFWISGESYAGIYVPSTALQVVQNGAGINLKGILVGNGCIGDQAGHCGNDPTGLNDYHDIQQWRGHGLIAETTYDTIMKICDWPNESAACQNALNQAANEVGNIDVYYLYNTCNDPAYKSRLRAPINPKGMLARALKAAEEKAKREGLELDPNCFGTGPTLENWFNQDSVKQAFHVAPAIDWALCSNNGTFQYNPNIADERVTVYPGLVKAGLNILIYNGEADLCVPYTDNEWWTRSMNYTVKKGWHAWNVQGSEGSYVGGYATVYNPPGTGSFTFATVRGAGHMVPETRPEAAFAMLQRHITGKGF